MLCNDIAFTFHPFVLREASPLNVGHHGAHFTQEGVVVVHETLSGRSLGRRRAVRKAEVELLRVSVAPAAEVDEERQEEEPRPAASDVYRPVEVPLDALQGGAGSKSASDICLLHGS